MNHRSSRSPLESRVFVHIVNFTLAEQVYQMRNADTLNVSGCTSELSAV